MARDLLTETQRQMAFMGWQGSARTGFDWKRDADGKQIARHHDATWWADYAEAEAFCKRMIARDERDAELRRRTAGNVSMFGV